jgi:hypothetical protein
MEEYIYENENTLSDEFCDEIVQYFESNVELHKMGGMNENDKYKDQLNENYIFIDNNEIINKNIRNSITLSLNCDIDTSNNEIEKMKQQLLKNTLDNISIYYEKYKCTNINFRILQRNTLIVHNFIINKYVKNEGKIIYHSDEDYNIKMNEVRLFTCIWFLNDVYEGGETEFFKKINVIPKKGKIMIFPAEWFFPHCGKVPISNDKYIVTAWVYMNCI